MTNHSETAAFALFKDGKQISKAHKLRDAAIVEAFERKAVVSSSGDFWGGSYTLMADGYEVREVVTNGMR